MTRFRSFFFIVIFAVALLAGFESGAVYGQSGPDIGGAVYVPFEKPPENQHNILILVADRIDSRDATLESVWLMAYYSDLPRIDFIPIFRASEGDPGNSSLADHFELLPTGEPGESFWHAMQGMTWWNGYMLLDKEMAGSMMDHISSEARSQADEIGLPAPSLQAGGLQSGDGPGGRFTTAQCQNLNAGPPPLDMALGLIFNHEHFRTSLTHQELFEAWRVIHSYGGALRCEFPTLSQNVP